MYFKHGAPQRTLYIETCDTLLGKSSLKLVFTRLTRLSVRTRVLRALGVFGARLFSHYPNEMCYLSPCYGFVSREACVNEDQHGGLAFSRLNCVRERVVWVLRRQSFAQTGAERGAFLFVLRFFVARMCRISCICTIEHSFCRVICRFYLLFFHSSTLLFRYYGSTLKQIVVGVCIVYNQLEFPFDAAPCGDKTQFTAVTNEQKTIVRKRLFAHTTERREHEISTRNIIGIIILHNDIMVYVCKTLVKGRNTDRIDNNDIYI